MTQKKTRAKPTPEMRMAQAKTLGELDNIYANAKRRAKDRRTEAALDTAYKAAKLRLAPPSKPKAPRKSKQQREQEEFDALFALFAQEPRQPKAPGPKRQSKETPKSGNNGKVSETPTLVSPVESETTPSALFPGPTPTLVPMAPAVPADPVPAHIPLSLEGLRELYLGPKLIELGSFCQGCGGPFHPNKRSINWLNRRLELDHIVPKSNGGTDEWSNLTLLCGGGLDACNQRKGEYRTLGWLQDENRKPGGALTAEREKYIQHGKVKH